MSFQLVPHLPRLVAMVAMYFMCERKECKFIYLFLVILLLFFHFFISTSDPLQADGCKLSVLLKFHINIAII